jgi:hypothetical protein
MCDVAWEDMSREQRDAYVEAVEQQLEERYGPDE